MAGKASILVAQARSWIGCKESDGSHRKIIDVYNGHQSLARGYKVQYTDAWCATFVSACAIKTGMSDIIPTECGCGQMVQLFQNLGEWDENDARVPKAGDIIFYDWDDSGSGDNTGWPDHVGIVESVSGNNITVIEGNKNNAVGRRTLQVNARYIRGYGVPKYVAEGETSGGTAGSGASASKNPTTGASGSGGLCKTPQWVGKVTADRLNVRSWAGTENANIKSWPVLGFGNLVDVCDSILAKDGSKWFYVRIDGRIYGFVHSGYIEKE